MPTRPLDRLMFAQGGLCFFCRQPLAKNEANVEHLVASANGGGNNDDNCVACCKTINALLGSMSLKEKVQVVLNQRGHFKCPNEGGEVATLVPPTPAPQTHMPKATAERLAAVVADLRKRGAARPRTLKTLTSTVAALFQKKLSEHEVALLVDQLGAQGVIVISGAKITYDLSQTGA
jgi:hypothetical protein